MVSKEHGWIGSAAITYLFEGLYEIDWRLGPEHVERVLLVDGIEAGDDGEAAFEHGVGILAQLRQVHLVVVELVERGRAAESKRDT